jgi:hypothetical protein
MVCRSVRLLAGSALWLAAALCASAAAPAAQPTVRAGAAEPRAAESYLLHSRPGEAAEAAAAHRRVLGESPRRPHVGSGGAPRGAPAHGAEPRAATGAAHGFPPGERAAPHPRVGPGVRVAAHALRARALAFFHSTAPPPSA